MVTVVSLPTTAVLFISVVIWKVAVVDPAGTVTLAGSLAALDGSTARDTSMSERAGVFSVTAPSTELPPTTFAEFRLTEESAGFSAALMPASTSPRRNGKTTVFKARIVTPLRSELKNDVYDGRRIDRLTFVQCRLELDSRGGFHCLFIESISQPLQYPNHVYLTVGGENDLQPDFAINS